RFLARQLARFHGGVVGLVFLLVADLVALGLAGDEVDLAGVDQRALHVLDEGLGVDVLVAAVAHGPNDHGRHLVLGDVGVVPRGVQAIADHFLGDQPRIGVVPAARQVDHAIVGHAVDLG